MSAEERRKQRGWLTEFTLRYTRPRPKTTRKMSDADTKPEDQTSPNIRPRGRVLAIDLGTKRVGVAVSDELGVTARSLPPIARSNWKELLNSLSDIVRHFDARTVVMGLPLRLDGTEGDAAADVRRVARNLGLSLSLPVHLQDERLTSKAAEQNLRASGRSEEELSRLVDGEAARLILLDFLSRS